MNKNLKLIGSIILGIVIIYFLFKEIGDIEDLKSIKIPVISIILGISFFFLIKLVNTFRYAFTYSVKPSIKLFSFLCSSNMMLSLLPFRTGELFYITGFKKYFNVDSKKGTSNLILIRLADYMVVYLLVLIASLYVSSNIKGNLISIISISFFASLLLAFFVILFIIKKDINLIKNAKIAKLTTLLKEIISAHKKSRKDFLIILSISLAYWLLRITMGFLILGTLGIKLSFIVVIFFSLIMLLIGLLPIKTFGDFGLFEGGWTLLLISAGFNPEQALPVILSYHLLLFLIPIVYGIVGYFLITKYKFYNH